MKLYMIKYKVTVGEGEKGLTFEDQMAVPAATEKQAKTLFNDIVGGVGAIIMSPGSCKILVPTKALGGVLSITSCTAVKAG